MIVDLGLDPEAIRDLAHPDMPSFGAAAQRELLRSILAHGYLLLPNREATAALTAIVDGAAFSQGFKTKWLELLVSIVQSKRVGFADPALEGSFAARASDGGLHFGPQAIGDGIAIVPRSDFQQLFPNSDSPQVNVAGLTMTTADQLGETSAISRRQSLSDSGLHPHGTSRDFVWEDLFRPLTRRSSSFVMFDRYLLKELASRQSRSSQAHPEHLVWLLEHIDSAAALRASVHLVAQAQPEHGILDAQDALDLVLSSWTPVAGNITELKVTVSSWTDTGRRPHNRHFRFGKSLGFDLIEGFDRLRSPNLWDPEGIRWQYHWLPSAIGAMVRRETDIAGGPTASHITQAI